MSEALMKHHLDAFDARDVDEILMGYSEDAVIITPEAVVRGKDAIRMQYELVTKTLLPEGSQFQVKKSIVEGNVGYLVWQAETDHFKFPFASDTFVFEDGKIKTHTLAFVMEAKQASA